MNTGSIVGLSVGVLISIGLCATSVVAGRERQKQKRRDPLLRYSEKASRELQALLDKEVKTNPENPRDEAARIALVKVLWLSEELYSMDMDTIPKQNPFPDFQRLISDATLAVKEQKKGSEAKKENSVLLEQLKKSPEQLAESRRQWFVQHPDWDFRRTKA